MIELQVYVANNCWACAEARRIIASVTPCFPDISFKLTNISDPHSLANVFAVPTYQLNGRTIFLGNPTVQELSQELTKALPARWP